MNLPRRRVVVFFAVLVFVAVGLLVSTPQGTNTPLGQTNGGRQQGVSTGVAPASVALLSSVVTAGVAALAILATNRRAAEHQEHERLLKREELEAQRLTRLRDERIRVYSEFASRWTSYEDAWARSPREEAAARTELMRSFNALSLLAPEEVRAAAAVVMDRAIKRQQQNEAPGRFWKAARKDLEIPD